MNQQQYERQRAFTDRWRQQVNEEPVALTKDLVLALHKEADELLDEVPWKSHRVYDSHEVLISNIREEVIDVLKYAFAIAQVWGITYEDLKEEFEVKSDVVEDRWRQEHEDREWGDRPLVLVDLDGVLNRYPEPFLEFVAARTGVFWQSMEALEHQAPEVKVKMKHQYRQSGIKRHLPEVASSVAACRLLNEAGYGIIVMSQRPYPQYARIYGDTIYWLRSKGVPYRRLIFADNKQRRLLLSSIRERIAFAVDDDPDVADRLRDLGLKVYEVRNGYTMLDIPEVIACPRSALPSNL